jgi:hypothetical protein
LPPDRRECDSRENAHRQDRLFLKPPGASRRNGAAEPRLTGASYRPTWSPRARLTPPSAGWLDYADMKALFDPVCRRWTTAALTTFGLEDDASPERVAAWAREQMRPTPRGSGKSASPWWATAASRRRPCPPTRWRGCRRAWDSPSPPPSRFPSSPRRTLCHRLHGHTYRVEAAADGGRGAGGRPAGDARNAERPAHQHGAGLEQSTCERICAHIWRFLEERGLGPRAVVVQETPNNRCVCLGDAAGGDGT